MNHRVAKVNEANYHLFDDMIYWRKNDTERTQDEKEKNHKEQIIPKELNNINFKVFAIETDDKFVAWISLIYLPKVGRTWNNGYIYVDELWVQTSHRRQGYAKILMEKADEFSNELKTVGVRLGVNVNNPSALNLYEQCGYGNTGQADMMEKKRSS